MKRILLLLTLAIIITTSSITTALLSTNHASGYESHPEPLSGGKPEI